MSGGRTARRENQYMKKTLLAVVVAAAFTTLSFAQATPPADPPAKGAKKSKKPKKEKKRAQKDRLRPVQVTLTFFAFYPQPRRAAKASHGGAFCVPERLFQDFGQRLAPVRRPA